ncbi:MAG: LysR family transcriptional regulator [Lewinellaceae bacterium]|nr:LysR family transcriptional regulator [Lewinellaceae bacterium]
MNIQQLEYIVALASHRHFGKAADACHVTQPTLSMMIQRLEEELEVKIFDRSRQPVITTQVGQELIDQARQVLHEVELLREIASATKGKISGELRLAIIPTLSPYLLPLFLPAFVKKYPEVKLKITERTTAQIIDLLRSGALDAGILVTPLPNSGIRETPLFYEPFVVYSAKDYGKEYLLPEDIDPSQLLLLEEGHCLRSQILNICALRSKSNLHVEYEAGSLETLKQLADVNNGITILPELATLYLSKEQLKKVKRFAEPVPLREVSLVAHRHLVKQSLVNALIETVLAHLPKGRVRFEGVGVDVV